MDKLASVRLDWTGTRQTLWMSVFFLRGDGGCLFVTTQALDKAKQPFRPEFGWAAKSGKGAGGSLIRKVPRESKA